MRHKIAVGLGIALILALVFHPYGLYDCGERTQERKLFEHKGTKNQKVRSATIEPFRNWRGECFAVVTEETRFYEDPTSDTIKVMVFRMKPGPVTLVETR